MHTRSLFPVVYDIAMTAADHGRLGQWRAASIGPARGRILELGAGTGLNFAYYCSGTWVIATDPDLAMLERAKVRAGRANAKILLVAADAEVLPFRAWSFDEGISGLAMCTIPRPERALAELRRVLRPGSVLRLLEHVRVAQPLAGRMQDWLTPFWRRIAGGCHLNRTTAEAVASSGFEITRVTSHLGGYVQEIIARTPGARDALTLPTPTRKDAMSDEEMTRANEAKDVPLHHEANETEKPDGTAAEAIAETTTESGADGTTSSDVEDMETPNPPRTTTGWLTAPKFGSAGGGGLELEPGPERT